MGTSRRTGQAATHAPLRERCEVARLEFPYGECDCLAPIITEVELDHCRDCYGTCRGHWACYRHKRVGHLLPS